jgi:hypothetical protein
MEELKEYKNGAKYFSNVEKVLQSIKQIQSSSTFKITSNNEKLMMNMIKGLATIADTQNDILKYIISHDNKAIIDDKSDGYTAGQFVFYIPYETIAVIKEVIDSENIKIHIIAQSIDKTVNIKDLK